MFLHKYKVDEGTIYLLNSTRNPGSLNISLPSKAPTVGSDTVKNLLKNLDSKFTEDPLPEDQGQPEEKKQEQPEEEKKPKEEEKKASIATVIRRYVSTLKE